MTDLERAADLVSRAIPIGFSTPEDNAQCCAIIDGLAIAILGLKDEEPQPDDGSAMLVATLRRLEEANEMLAIELAAAREELAQLKQEHKILASRHKILASRGRLPGFKWPAPPDPERPTGWVPLGPWQPDHDPARKRWKREPVSGEGITVLVFERPDGSWSGTLLLEDCDSLEQAMLQTDHDLRARGLIPPLAAE